MFTLFSAPTADDAWQQIASHFRAGVDISKQPSRVGLTYEILRGAITIHDARQRWVFSRRPAINPAFALAEVVWIVRGRRDSRFLTYFNNELPRYAGEGPVFHGAYGFRMRHHFGIDQFERAFSALCARPHTRQVVLQFWDPRADLPSEDGREAAPDIPCNVLAMLKVRDGVLDWTQILRSNDVFRGLPYNLVQFTMLHEILAGWLGLDLGSHNLLSDSLHVYDDCLDQVKDSLPIVAPHNTDSLSMQRPQSESSFMALELATERLIDPSVSADDVVTLALTSTLSQSFKNMLCVLSAEGVRRRQRPDLVEPIMSVCTNNCYRVLMERWLARTTMRAQRSAIPT
jgi:thymidylate synthase